MVHVNAFVEEGGCRVSEFFFRLCGEVNALAAPRASGIHFGVAVKVVLQAMCYQFSLRNDVDTGRHVLFYLVQKKGIMGASQDDRVYLVVPGQQLVDVFLDEVVGTGCLCLVVLDQRYPHGAGLSRYLDFGEELAYLHDVRFRLDGTGCGQDADVSASSDVADALYGGADDSQHASFGVEVRQVVDLYAAQGLGRGCVAGQYDQMASQFEESGHRLEGKFVNDFEGACPIGGTGIVAQIDEIVLWEYFLELAQDGESAIARVEHTDGARL